MAKKAKAVKLGKSVVDPLAKVPGATGDAQRLGAAIEAKGGGKAKPSFKDFGMAKVKANKKKFGANP